MPVKIPSQRSFDIYHAVALHGQSIREVAENFGLSPTRVRQIVIQTRSFVSHHGAGEILETNPHILPLGALRIAHGEMQVLLAECMKQWSLATGAEDQRVSPQAVRFIQQALELVKTKSHFAACISAEHRNLMRTGVMRPDPEQYVYEGEPEAALPTSPPAPALTSPPTSNNRPNLPPPTNQGTNPLSGGCTPKTTYAAHPQQQPAPSAPASPYRQTTCDNPPTTAPQT